MLKIKKGDTVLIRSGKDKGKKGKVLSMLAQEGMVVVEGLNMQTKHMRPRKQGEKGQKISYPKPLPISVVMVVCKECKKPSRMGLKILADKQKVRLCKKCKAEIK